MRDNSNNLAILLRDTGRSWELVFTVVLVLVRAKHRTTPRRVPVQTQMYDVLQF